MIFIASKAERDVLQLRMLYYRYGEKQPFRAKRPRAVLPMSRVAELLQAPLETLNWLDRKYFTCNSKEPAR